MRRLFDLQIDFFLPVWRRVAVIAVCFAWGIFEFSAQAPMWGLLFVALGALAGWQFFFDGWPARRAGDENRTSG